MLGVREETFDILEQLRVARAVILDLRNLNIDYANNAIAGQFNVKLDNLARTHVEEQCNFREHPAEQFRQHIVCRRLWWSDHRSLRSPVFGRRFSLVRVRALRWHCRQHAGSLNVGTLPFQCQLLFV